MVRIRRRREATKTVRALSLGIRAFRETWSHTGAFEELAPFLGLKPRKVRSVAYGESNFDTMRESRQSDIRAGVVKALRWYANELRARADYWDRVAEQQEIAERRSVGIVGDPISSTEQTQLRAMAVYVDMLGKRDAASS